MTFMARLSDIEGITVRSRHLFGPLVAVAGLDPRGTPDALWPEEEDAVRAAVPSRRREFAIGRTAARLAMDQLGTPAKAIPTGEDRAPVWPGGIVGSLSHTRTACVAALAHAADLRSIGIDIETNDALPEDLIPVVCTAQEQDWLETQPAGQRGVLAKLIFSAKECAYKCQYPLTRQLFGFETLTILPGTDARGQGVFEATFTRPIGGFVQGSSLKGRYAMDAGFVITAMTLTHAQAVCG